MLLGLFLFSGKGDPALCSSWAPAVRVSLDDRYDDWGPAIDVDSKGVVWVVWDGRDPVELDREVYFTRWVSGVWDEPQRLHGDNRVDDTFPRICVGRDDVPWVAWKTGYDFRNWDVVVSKWSDGWWSEPDTLAEGVFFVAENEVCAWDSERAWVSWHTHSASPPYDFEVYVRSYVDGVWGQVWTFDRSAYQDWRPSLTAAGPDEAWIVWDSSPTEAGRTKICASRSSGASWGQPAEISKGVATGSMARNAVDPLGDVWAIWGGPYLSDLWNEEVLYNRCSGGVWESVGKVNVPDDRGQSDIRPVIYAGDRSWPAVAWNAVLDPDDPPYVDVRYSAWDGQGWTPEEVISVYEPPEMGWDEYPDVAVGPDGRVWVAWLKEDGPPGKDKDVVVTYSDDALPVVTYDCAARQVWEGIELNWKAFGYGDLGSYNVYRLERSAVDSLGSREIPSRSARVNSRRLAGVEEVSYVDRGVADHVEYCYWLEHESPEGVKRTYWVGREVAPARELRDRIRAVWPNPSGAGVSVNYEVRAQSAVSFQVFDAAGRMVTLADLGRRDRGIYEAEEAYFWDGRGRHGNKVPAGIYFVSMKTGAKLVDESKIVLLR